MTHVEHPSHAHPHNKQKAHNESTAEEETCLFDVGKDAKYYHLTHFSTDTNKSIESMLDQNNIWTEEGLARNREYLVINPAPKWPGPRKAQVRAKKMVC
jgi:hypothetical protein